jgi:hypothetical protein
MATRLWRAAFVAGTISQLAGCATTQAPQPAPTAAPAAPSAAPEAIFKTEELEQLAAPIALYPDALLAQVLMASTYPLEVVQASRWVKANPGLKDKALQDAAQQQPWDASVISLTAFPQVLGMMNEKLDWTQKLGDAFLAQPKDVMDVVQRLRAKAQAQGNLESNEQQKVTVEQTPAGQTTVIIEPADPQVVYVPTYNPTVAYGGWPYPAYPPYYYYPPGYYAGAAWLSFGIGIAVGGALWGDCDWHGGDVDIDIDRYNEFNRDKISNRNWEHKPEHRKGAQYRDKASQRKYGQASNRAAASTREAYRGRAEQGRQDLSRNSDQIRRDLERGDGARRDSAADRGRPSQRDARVGGRDSGAFQGMDNGAAARRDSDRGRSSRQSASGWGGGSRGGGSYGGRSGGYGGGGGRGGFGGGRGGGGRGGRR